MAQVQDKSQARAAVAYTEYERGWGSKTFAVDYYDDINEAQDAANKCNARNTEKHAPDYYIIAEVRIIK